jgi:hypothetical protein
VSSSKVWVRSTTCANLGDNDDFAVCAAGVGYDNVTAANTIDSLAVALATVTPSVLMGLIPSFARFNPHPRTH